MTFEKLYYKVLEENINSDNSHQISLEYDQTRIDCLLHPEKYPVVIRTGNCSCNEKEMDECVASCIFGAISKDGDGNIFIDKDKCTGCLRCVENCKASNLTDNKEVLPVLYSIKNSKGPIYVLIAPAFIGQFSKDVTPGKLRTAFKKLGFDGMLEVALFADILTLKEALEFDKNIVTDTDFQLTSCCCPLWIAMIRRIYNELLPHVPGSVSPMIASGRTVKQIHPDATTVFIGPCVAKKAEARDKDISDAIDHVLTFQEMQDIFEFTDINPEACDESEKDHSSKVGRIYARTGGVSHAVKRTLEKINPNRKISIVTEQADGVPACKALIKKIQNGETASNFFEGMGCVGGCVGGPKIMIDREKGKDNVNVYGEEASYETPIDNPYVIELLNVLGFDMIEDLLEDSEIFTRYF